MSQTTAASSSGRDGRRARRAAQKKMTMVVMSGDMDKLFGAFIIATGARRDGHGRGHVLHVLGPARAQEGRCGTGKSLFGRMLGIDVRRRHRQGQPEQVQLRRHGPLDVRQDDGRPQRRHAARSCATWRSTLGVRMYGCQMSMDVMEIPQDTFVEGVQEPVGVGFMLMEAQESQIQFFI